MELSGVVLANRYQLERIIGRGGMGEVWLGRDCSMLQREVAVKVLPDLSGAEAVRRFQREATTLASLQHPGITVVHDAGQIGGCVKICDFGIARTADATSALTTTGHVIGTPAYMSPEQWQAQPLDARSDLYSLGCVMFELLTGRPPFPAASSIYALMRQHVEQPPPAPGTLRSEIPGRLQDLVLALLAKNPNDRPDVRTLATELAESASQDSDVGPPSTHRGELFLALPGHGKWPSIAFSPDGRTLASGAGKQVRIWDACTGELRHTLQQPGMANVSSVAFSSDGGTLASAGREPTVRLWDTSTGQPRSTLRHGLSWILGSSPEVFQVAFSPDGRTVASAESSGQSLCLWDVPTGIQRREIPIEAQVYSVAFSPDGHILASAGNDVIRLWNAHTSEPLLTLAHTGVHSLAFSPDGRILASAGNDDVIRLWTI